MSQLPKSSVALFAVAIAAGGASAQVYVTVSQNRQISVDVMQASQTDQNAAKDTGPFENQVSVSGGGQQSSANASAAQVSSLGVTLLSATGSGTTFANGGSLAPPLESADAGGVSTFDVTIAISHAVVYTLTCDLSIGANGQPGCSYTQAFASLAFSGPGGSIYSLTRTFQSNPGPCAQTSGQLAPGQYHLVAIADSCASDGWGTPGPNTGSAGFAVNLELHRVGDTDDDGQVDVSDLLAVVNAWGACPPPCPADVHPPDAGDGSVDINDLLTVINNWG